MEMQIYFDNTDAEYNRKAAVSFFFGETSKRETDAPIIPELGLSAIGNSKNIDLSAVFGELLLDPPYSRYFYYEGSQTVPECMEVVNWYLMETSFKIDKDAFNEIQKWIYAVTGGQGNSKNVHPRGERELLRGGCWPGYWTHSMNSNAGIWYMIPGMLIFFIITMVVENELEASNDKQFRQNDTTNHALYSVSNVSSVCFTRNSRFTLILISNIIELTVTATLYNQIGDTSWVMVFAYAFLAVVIAKIWQYLLGTLLYTTYKKTELMLDNPHEEVKYYLEGQNYYFYYYMLAFLTIVIGWIFICIEMYGRSTEVNTRWVVCTFVCFFLDWAVFETIFMKMSSGGMQNCCRKRGFYFDQSIYKKYRK